jgi:N4-gp56 family major capsid protein
MALTTTTEIAGPVNVVFQVNLLRNAKALAPYFMGTTPATIAEHSGTFTAKWRRIENFTPVTTALAELTGSVSFPTRTAVQPTVTDLTATVSKYGNFIYLNEEVDLINFTEQGAKLSELMGMNAGQSLNRLQRNIMEDNGTAIFGGTSTTATGVEFTGTASGNMTLAVIAETVNALNRQDALKFLPMTMGDRDIGTSPQRSAYWGITHVDAEEDIRALTGFNSVETYAGQTSVAQGEFGSVGGVRWISTTEASIDAGTGMTTTGSSTNAARGTSNRADVYNTLVFGQDWAGSVGLGSSHVKEIYRVGDRLPGVMMISHPKGSAGAGDPLNELSSMGWKSWHTGVILNGNYGRVIQHAVAKLTADE